MIHNDRHIINVAIADDQALIRTGFSMVINSQPDMRVIAQATDGEHIVQIASHMHPDIILMDVRMPIMDGIEATRRIMDHLEQACTTDTRVIILTTFDLDEYVMAAIHAGASGFLLKDTEPETLLHSIRTVYQGNAIIAPSATKRFIEAMLQRDNTTSNYHNTSLAPAAANHPHDQALNILDKLSPREREVLIEIARGLSNQEIADTLFISLPTVKTHVAHILTKINARDRVQAVVFAYKHGLVLPEN